MEKDMPSSRETDQPLEPVPSRLVVAMSGPVVRRALLYFFVVGSVLIAINHGDALWRGETDGIRMVKMLLTPVVPYVVSTLSSVSAIRANALERAGENSPK